MAQSDYFFPEYVTINGCFIVQNVTPQFKKTINIFNYPIPYGKSRDLLKIPGISEADIRASLLKGELKYKILAKDIVVHCSDVDLIQFNSAQAAFLEGSGIPGDTVEPDLIVAAALANLYPNGIGTGVGINYYIKENQILSGQIDGVNRLFKVPNGDRFINGTYMDNDLHIRVMRDGRQLFENIDYIVIDSLGLGTGYDTIKMISLAPISGSILWADYFVKS